MPLFIKDDITAGLVARLASLRGMSKQDAVKLAVQAGLDRDARTVPRRDRLAASRTTHALPPATGAIADKSFVDGLSDEP